MNFFQKYQKYVYALVAGVVIASFVFFGALGVMQEPRAQRVDRVLGTSVDGSEMRLLEIAALSRFISSDRDDVLQQRGANLLNDGVIRNDLIGSGIAELLVEKSFDLLKGDLGGRVQRVKAFRSYEHPEAPFVSAKAVWQRFAPDINREWTELQSSEVIDAKSFSHLARLYQLQNAIPSEYMRRILMMQEQQYKQWLKPDPALRQVDLSIFGFHSLADWFGRDFTDLMAEFIHNAAIVAQENGYWVSLEEARGDLQRIFGETLQKLQAVKWPGQTSYREQLQILGMDETEAASLWQKVLLFRRYFRDIGESVFVDRLPYSEFATVAHEKAAVDMYRWPDALKVNSDEELASLQAYIAAVAKPSKDPIALPSAILPVADVDPEFVAEKYRAKLFAIDKREVGLKAPLKEVWEFETSNWGLLRKEFSFLSDAKTADERFEILGKLAPEQRAKVDLFARRKLVDKHPEWVKESLDSVEGKETEIVLSNGKVRLPHIQDEAKLGSLFKKLDEVALRYFESGEGVVRFEQVEKISEPTIKTFREALADGSLEGKGDLKALKSALEKHKLEGSLSSQRFAVLSTRAREDLMKNPADIKWLGEPGDSPLIAQFKLQRVEKEVTRNSNDPWEASKPFNLAQGDWSDVHIGADGFVQFFCLKNRESLQNLEPFVLGKDMLIADMQKLLAGKIYSLMQQKEAIVIPLQPE